MPTIPPEGTYTDAERRFIDNQPPGLWPENQDSIFGQLRRVLTDEIQAGRDAINLLSQEMFVTTASKYLALWEEMMGAAIAPTGKSIAQRRAILLSRLKYGTFTRSQRNAIIADFVKSTFGQPAAFTLLGIPFSAGGIPLYGPLADPATLYRVYEDPKNFAYEVFIKNTNTPDIGALTRELTRMTPAGIAFTIDNTLANILSYPKMIRDSGPSGYWKLGAGYTDSSGNGFNGTASGAGLTSVAPIVLTTDSNATDFNGAAYVFVADAGLLKPTYGITIEAWINPDVVNARKGIVNKTDYYLQIDASGKLSWNISVNGGSVNTLIGSTILSAGTTYFVTATFDGKTAKLYVNGAIEGTLVFPFGAVLDTSTNQLEFGRVAGGNLYDGRIDEIAVYTYPMSQKRALEHFKTGINIP